MDLFNLNTDDFTAPKAGTARSVDENLYNPGPDQAQNGVYRSVIRFIPWIGDPAKSKYKKYYARLTNPLTGERFTLDCPSSLGKPYILWTLDLELRKLANEEPEIVKEIQKNFMRAYNYYSLVYIKKDPQFPQLEGKIKVYSFGYNIDNLIQQELNPEAELMNIRKINPYSMLEGKDMVLVVKRKTKSWRDYSSSKFMSETSPLILKLDDGRELPVNGEEKVQTYVKGFLEKNSPDLSQYFYKEWSDSDYEKVAEFIKAIIPHKSILDQVLANTRDERIKPYFSAIKSAQPVNRVVADDLDFAAPAKPVANNAFDDFDAPTQAPAAPVKAAPSNDFDDLLADL